MEELSLKYLSNPRVKYTTKKNNPTVGFYKERVLDLTDYLLENKIGGALQKAFDTYMDECTLYFHNEDMLETLQSKYEHMVLDTSCVPIELTHSSLCPVLPSKSKKINHFVKVKPRASKPFPIYQKFDDQEDKFKHKRMKDNIIKKYGDEEVQKGHMQLIQETHEKNMLLDESTEQNKECVEQHTLSENTFITTDRIVESTI